MAPPTVPYSATRDPSVTRGRALSATSPRNASPRGITPATQARAKQSGEVERKPSLYGHHRQTSIVHGVQHSRNPSLLSSANSSPLSPQKILASGSPDVAAAHGSAAVKKSPSTSTLHSATMNTANRGFEANGSQWRPERMHSGRVKRSHEHQRTQSKAHTLQDRKTTVGEYALHHLFTSFIAEADERIERCLPPPGKDDGPRIEDICGPGADPAFDQLISSIGYINRHQPKFLIDSAIRWRKQKADSANQMYNELQQLREAANQTQRFIAHGAASTPSHVSQSLHAKDIAVRQADRRSSVAIYVLCRVLIGVLGQTTVTALNGPDGSLGLAGRLEEVIYSQLQSAEPEMLTSDPALRSNWAIRGQLLGVMSGLRFEEVTERFIRDLEKAHKRLSIKGLAEPKLAANTALLVRSMRWLQFRTYPEDAWHKSCETLQTLARFFAEVHGRVMKHAYAELFKHILLPIAATATAQLNTPKCKEVVNLIQPKLTQMLPKADHWPHIYPLLATLLCVSPIDQFGAQWLPLITSVQPRAKDRIGRSLTLQAICRLVWRYLYRHSEAQSFVLKKLEEIVRVVFQGGKRVLISTDPVIADPLIQLIRIIGYKNQDFCFRAIIFPLMNSELFSGPERDLRIENLDPERTVIAIRAFLAIMTDLEKGEPPPFPTSFQCDDLLNFSPISQIMHRRTHSQGFTVTTGGTDRISRPVMTTNLNEITREYYVKFCKILGQITMICDNTFGGQAVLDEKLTTLTPKTPMAEAFNFNRREDIQNSVDGRQHYYDLLHVAVEALPRCLSPQLPINSLVNLLCKGTAHVQPHIASSSAQSLKSIARQSYAQQVTIGFARFIFNFDDRYATVSASSLLGPDHIENTLKLYVELLQIWIDDIHERTHRAISEPPDDDEPAKRAMALDLSGILAHVDEIESHGLFFLCSPSRAVRAIAVNVLRLVTKFDTALGKPSTRIISILEGSSQQVIDVNDERLSLAERSRLQKGLRKSNVNSTLVELCSSDIAHDAKLWFKIFPNLVKLSSEVCLHAVALTRELVCQRLLHSYQTISRLGDGQKLTLYGAGEQVSATGKLNARWTSSDSDVIIEQWKIHLIFACTTLTNTGGSGILSPSANQSSQHIRKSSKSSSSSSERIASASELFSRAVPFLKAPNASVRSAVVAGLGATNATLFQTLLECLQPWVSQCSKDAKERLGSHQRTVSSPRREQEMDSLRTEITHLLSLTCPLLKDPRVSGDDFAISFIGDYAKNLRLFLSDAEVQSELAFQKLRTHFCVLMEKFYDCIRTLKDGSRWMSFQSRQASFALMENWCGFSPNESQLRRRQEHLRRSLLDREHDIHNRGIINSAIEKEKNELQTAALSTMAALCAGPLNFVADNKVLMHFDVRRMLAWVGAIFEAPSDRTHAIGRRALQNLIVHNLDQTYLMAQTMRMCYIARTPKALTSYFEVITKVLTENLSVTTPFWKIICAGLYTLGNEDSTIRMKSARLLRTLEERHGKNSKLQDLDISVSDKTTAVYKLAQFDISRRLAKLHPELAFHVFSEFSAYFNELQPDHQRNMVSGMLPWIQTVELQVEPSGGPTATSYMLLVNLFEITVKSSIALHHEIQALWQALATGPYAGNVQLVLDFIIRICLEKKEHNFVIFAKQIVVFLSSTPAGSRVIEYLLLQICPKTMVAERREPTQAPVDTTGLPYVADLSVVLPGGAKQNNLSLGQLSMILLVDLVVSPIQLPPDKIPTLLQIVFVQWDQYINIVQDQAREMLVHLIHELVISKIEPGRTEPDKKSIEDFIESVRSHDQRTIWSYVDSEIRAGEEDGRAVSDPMAYVVDETVKVFSVAYPNIRADLGKVTMQWATSCAVRHVACRSFQVFRCVQTTLDQQMLADMLARLSNTIADDENHDYMVFSLEILTTLRCIISALTPRDFFQYPQLFWTTCACLDTIFEEEYQEALGMLDQSLLRMDLSDPGILKILRDSRPVKWEGEFQGLHNLLYKGMRSSLSMGRSLAIMEKLIKLPSNDIVGGKERLLFTVLANLPRYLHYFEAECSDTACLESAETLAAAANSQDHDQLSRVLDGFAKSRYRNERDFLSQTLNAIGAAFFPSFEFQSLVFLLGMVNNQTDWVKVKTMQILCSLVPEIDMRRPEIVSQGPDLISPLLRLLQTKHCQQAIDCLDNVIEITETPLDNKHLRMSMAGSHSSRETRKEYDSTKSLFGIPVESGWSIPMPAIYSSQTRANVHSVFYTLTYPGSSAAQERGAATPEIEFLKEEYQYDSYFGERTATMMSDDTRIDGNMGELAMKLDSLDYFFDDEQADTMSPLDSDGNPRYPSGLIVERENLYDQQALPILHRSLQRNASVTSLQTGFATNEPRYQREQAVMNPAAFAKSSQPPSRPGLHGRSITSPATTLKRSPPHLQNDMISGDEDGEDLEPFSDDDMPLGRAHIVDEQHRAPSSIKPAGIRAGLRQGLRRLTSSGGGREVRETLRAGISGRNKSPSPKVPKVPTSWLQDPASAEP